MHQWVSLGAAEIGFVGFPDRRVEALVAAASNIRIDDIPLERSRVSEATLFPLTPRADGRFFGGVCDSTGASIRFAETHRHDLGRVIDLPPSAGQVPLQRHPNERALFGGALFGGYGHILLESLNRLWAAQDEPDLDILFIGAQGSPAGKNWALLKEFANLLQISPDRLVLVSHPTKVADLVVPEPGLELGLRTSLKHSAFIQSALEQTRAAYAEHTLPSAAYVSRSKLNGLVRKPLGEVYIEEAILRNGSKVYWPELLKLQDQVAAFNNHSTYAGFIGSHLHNLFLRDTRKPVDCAYFCSDTPNLNFIQIDMLLPGRRIYCVASRFAPVYEFGNRAPFRIDTLAVTETLARFGLSVEVSDDPSMNDANYVEHWAYLMFHHKVLRPLELRVRAGRSSEAKLAVETAIIGMVEKLARGGVDFDHLCKPLIGAYKKAERHVGAEARGIAERGRALLLEELSARTADVELNADLKVERSKLEPSERQ